MKNLPLFGLFLALSFLSKAQDCAKMHDYFKEGVSMEYTDYDDKGKVTGMRTQKVTRIYKSRDTLVAVVESILKNKKGKETSKGTFPIKCLSGTIFMDCRSVTPSQEQTRQRDDMEVEIRSIDQRFPYKMSVGQSLPDAELETTIRLRGLQLFHSIFLIKNRKAEAEETVTTAAGTYNCMRVSYDVEFQAMGNRTIHTVCWYSQSVGMVKSINYDKKGKEENRQELTTFVK
ncbi:MAG: hypothetical protein KA138_08025 [Saprospiraceae bacterium]|nr:hypothetical protein [Saprospiraceae bacterium]